MTLILILRSVSKIDGEKESAKICPPFWLRSIPYENAIES
jgi:hypothetical protein